MVSKSTIKLIKSLAQKKFRTKEKLFIVEGDKNVVETLKSNYSVQKLFATKTFILNHSEVCSKAKELLEVDSVRVSFLH